MAALTAGRGADAAAHARLLADKSLQLDFPNAPPPTQPPAWLRDLANLLSHLAPAFKWMMWGALGAVALVLLYFIVRELAGVRFSRRRREASPQVWTPDPEQARRLLEDADDLASHGDFAGAVHALLHRSIDEFDHRKAGVVRPALTSRDIAALEALPPAAKPAFGMIASIVERSFFGGAPVGADDFARCRAAYADFALGRIWA